MPKHTAAGKSFTGKLKKSLDKLAGSPSTKRGKQIKRLLKDKKKK